MDVIETPRLRLELVTEAALSALAAGDRAAASAAQGLEFGADFPIGPGSRFLDAQLSRMRDGAGGLPWCVRAVRLADGGSVIGHAGFHGPPWLVGRAEIGYQIAEPHRRQGFATETATALVDFAFARGESRVYASVLPGNVASLRVIAKVGFTAIGQQIDEVDGLELVFVKEAPAP